MECVEKLSVVIFTFDLNGGNRYKSLVQKPGLETARIRMSLAFKILSGNLK